MGLALNHNGYYKVNSVYYDEYNNYLHVNLAKFDRRHGKELSSLDLSFKVDDMKTDLDLDNLVETAYSMIKEDDNIKKYFIDIMEEDTNE